MRDARVRDAGRRPLLYNLANRNPMHEPDTDDQPGRRAAADLWKNTLSQIPTVFGRLVYLASLRNANSGRYEHHGLALIFDEDRADAALRESHEGVFEEWLNYSLERKKEDLQEYLSELDEDLPTTLRSWTGLAPYRNWPPAAAGQPERNYYLSDLEALLDLLRRAHGVVCRDPDA
jgi:hypothetical protein